jgi:phosphoribosylformylglycinamidine synthase
VENADTPWTAAYEAGEVVEFPIAHGEGRFEIPDDRLDELEADDRILFRYCDAEGNVTDESNPNGSKHNVAGVTGEENVAVMMPHPERVSLPELGSTAGRGVLRGFVES